MDKSSNINLSIAALQSRRRSRALVGIIALIILICVAIGLLLFEPSGTQQNLSAPSLDKGTPALRPNIPLKQLPVPKQSNRPELDSAVIRSLGALSDDAEYGALAANIAIELQNSGQISVESERELTDALTQKLASLDKALSQAFIKNNFVLVEKLSSSSFFVNYGANRMPNWGWLTTPTFERYEQLSKALSQAETKRDNSQILETLISIQQVTGFEGFRNRIIDLRNILAAEYESGVTEQMVSSMSAGRYEEVLQLADRHRALVNRDRKLQDLTRQAEMALAQKRRDELLLAAVTQANSDQWEAAVKTIGAIPRNLLNDDLRQLEQNGKLIIQARQSLQELMVNPARLTDASVEAYALRELDSAEELAGLSTSLADAIAELRSLLDQALETVTVNIFSDNRATILIPRLGYVQPTRQKTLELQRKQYEFIIRCEGERDKLKQVDLRDTAVNDTFDVRLACEN